MIGYIAAAGGLALVAAVGASSSSSSRRPKKRGSSSSSSSSGRGPSSGSRSQALAELRELAGRLEWPTLPDYLQVVGYTESRFNSNAINAEADANAARGWFGMRPNTALVGPLEGEDPNLLLDRRVSVAAAADLAWRLGGPAHRGERPRSLLEWQDIRRGWALPSLVDDFDYAKVRSQQVLGRLEQSERANDLFIASDRAFTITNWRGLEWALERVGFNG